MAHRMNELGEIPELILTSPANRALNTALIMAKIWKLDSASLQIHDTLYMAYVPEIEEVVGQAPASVRKLAVFGHNPSFTLYANKFLNDPLDNLPTAGIVLVTLESESWNGINRTMVIKTYVDYPKRKRQPE
jgi:phosphohistidine phosphatase